MEPDLEMRSWFAEPKLFGSPIEDAASTMGSSAAGHMLLPPLIIDEPAWDCSSSFSPSGSATRYSPHLESPNSFFIPVPGASNCSTPSCSSSPAASSFEFNALHSTDPANSHPANFHLGSFNCPLQNLSISQASTASTSSSDNSSASSEHVSRKRKQRSGIQCLDSNDWADMMMSLQAQDPLDPQLGGAENSGGLVFELPDAGVLSGVETPREGPLLEGLPFGMEGLETWLPGVEGVSGTGVDAGALQTGLGLRGVGVVDVTGGSVCNLQNDLGLRGANGTGGKACNLQIVPIDQYSWRNEELWVRIIIPLPGVHEFPESCIATKFGTESLELTVRDFAKGIQHKLVFKQLYGEIAPQKCSFYRRPNKLVLKLVKVPGRMDAYNKGRPLEWFALKFE